MRIGKKAQQGSKVPTSRLMRTTLLYFASNAGSRVVSAVLIPVYALYVSPADLGRFDFAQTWANVLAPVAFIAIWESLIRFAMYNALKSEAERVIGDVVYFTLAAAAVVLCLTVGFVLVWQSQAQLVAPIAVFVVVQGVSTVWQYGARARGERRLFAMSGVWSALANLALTVILVAVFRLGFSGLWSAYLISQVLIVALIEWRLRLVRGALANRPSLQRLAPLFRFSGPLVLNLVSLVLLSGFGRIVITTVLGSGENGEYVFAMRVSTIVSSVGSVAAMATIEETIARIGSESIGDFFAVMIDGTWRVLIALAVLALGALRVAEPILEHTGYAASGRLIPPMLLFAVLSIMGTNYGNAFQAALKMKYAAYTTVIGALVCVAGSLVAIYPFGTLGVALALCLGTAVTLLARGIAAHRLIQFAKIRSWWWLLGVFAFTWFAFDGAAGAPTWIAFLLLGSGAAFALIDGTRAIRQLTRISDATAS